MRDTLLPAGLVTPAPSGPCPRERACAFGANRSRARRPRCCHGATAAGPARGVVRLRAGEGQGCARNTARSRAERAGSESLMRLRNSLRLGRSHRGSCPAPGQSRAQHGAAGGRRRGRVAELLRAGPWCRARSCGSLGRAGSSSPPCHGAVRTGAPPAEGMRSPSLPAALPSKIHLGKMKAHANTWRLLACAFNHGKLALVPPGPPKRHTAAPHRGGVGAPSAAQRPPLPGAFRLLGAAPTPCLTRLAQQFSYPNAVVTGKERRDR